MKRFIVSVFLSLFVFSVSAQKVYFVYLQSEQGQPFFVKMGEKIYSSTASGYLILSKLHDSTYNFTVGFPDNKIPEQKYSVTLNKKDHGYLLKDFGDKGWGLFDLQTLSVQMSTGENKTGAMINTDNSNVSAFTDILSKAADDPSLRVKPVQIKTEEKKAEPQLVVNKEEEKVNPTQAVVKVDEKKNEEVNTSPAKSTVKTKSKGDRKKEVLKATPTDVVKMNNTNSTSDPIVKLDDKKEEPESTHSDPIVKEEKKKNVPKGNALITDEEKSNAVQAKYIPSVVTKGYETRTGEGYGLVYIDQYPTGNKDTIEIIIPNPPIKQEVVKDEPKEENKIPQQEVVKDKVNVQPKDEIKVPQQEEVKEKVKDEPIKEVAKQEVKQQPKDDKKFLDITIDPTANQQDRRIKEPVKTDAVVADKKESPKNEVTVVSPTITCNGNATETDFFKLRKKMAAESTDDGMISEAKKSFKQKCFSVSQVRNLSVLFLSDGSKYQFFDAVYNYVRDADRFASLQSELKDPYFLNRFKAMLRN